MKGFSCCVCFGIVLSALLCAPMQVYAQDSEADLKVQVETLSQRVAELEAQLKQKESIKYKRPKTISSNVWDPFEDMRSIQERMDQMFSQSFGGSGFGGGAFDPQTDLKETDTHFIITMDLPGMDKEKISVEAKDGLIHISGERNSSNSEEGEQFYRQERSFGYFSRAIPVPEGAEIDSIDAKYDNGVLTIKIDKKANIPQKQINKIQVY